MPNVFLTPPRSADVSIVSDEGQFDMKPLVDALERRGLVSEIITGAEFASAAPSGVRYIRRLDPTLTNLAYVARSLSRKGGPADINPPRSVRLTEWAPLANHALRQAGWHSRDAWCIDAQDVKRKSVAFGLPVVIQGVASRSRVLAETFSRVESAAHAVEAGVAPYGVLVEQPLAESCSSIDVLEVARHTAGFAVGGGNDLNDLDAGRIERMAIRAVDALGGDIMVVAVATDSNGVAHVREVDAAPALSRFGRPACESIADEIARRVAGARASSSATGRRERRRERVSARLTSTLAAGR